MIDRKHVSRGLLLCLLAMPMAAQAASFTYTGSGSSGTDPLSGGWTAGPNTFGFPTFVEPLVNNEFPTFKGGNGLDYATSVVFTYTGSDPQDFNMLLGSGLTHVASPQGSTWDTTYLSPNSVQFTAEGDDRLNIGDTFDIQVAFTNAINPDNFGFTLTWSDGQTAAVPEPASWAMMLGGFGMLGGVMRRRRNKAIPNLA